MCLWQTRVQQARVKSTRVWNSHTQVSSFIFNFKKIIIAQAHSSRHSSVQQGEARAFDIICIVFVVIGFPFITFIIL